MRMKKFAAFLLATALTCAMACMSVSAAELDVEYYMTHNPDVVAQVGTDHELLKMHYETFGIMDGRMANATDYSARQNRITGLLYSAFDASYYAEQNPEVVALVGNDAVALFNHFVTQGIKQGLNPSAAVNLSSIAKEASGLEGHGGVVDALCQFVVKEISEGRMAMKPATVSTSVVSADGTVVNSVVSIQTVVSTEARNSISSFIRGQGSPESRSSSSASSSGSSHSSHHDDDDEDDDDDDNDGTDSLDGVYIREHGWGHFEICGYSLKNGHHLWATAEEVGTNYFSGLDADDGGGLDEPDWFDANTSDNAPYGTPIRIKFTIKIIGENNTVIAEKEIVDDYTRTCEHSHLTFQSADASGETWECDDCQETVTKSHSTLSVRAKSSVGTHEKYCTNTGCNYTEDENCTIEYEQKDESVHVKKCSVCNASEEEAHSFVDGVCEKCGEAEPASP